MNKFLLKFAALSMIITGVLFTPALVSADCSNPANTQEAIQCGASNSAGVPVGTDAGSSLDNTITNGINLLSIVVGIIAVVMIVLAGFRYITSGGKQESISGAKSALTYAIIGLIIVALAQVIARFALHTATSPPSTSQSSSGSGSSCPNGQPVC